MSIKFESASPLPLAILQNPVAPSGSASVTNNNFALCSGSFDNSDSTDLFFWTTAELVSGFGSGPTIGNAIELYLIPSPSGVRFPDVDITSVPPTISPNHYKGNFYVVKNQTAVQTMMIDGVPLSPFPLKGYIVNKTGQTMSAGWQLNLYPYREQ